MLRTLSLCAGILGLLGLLVWAVGVTRDLSPWTAEAVAVEILMVVGALGVGALTAALMWLAFFSDRRAYDEPPIVEPQTRNPAPRKRAERPDPFQPTER